MLNIKRSAKATTGKRTIQLWHLSFPVIIVKAKTGIVYTNQTGGLSCNHPEMEGFVLPLIKPNKKYKCFDPNWWYKKAFVWDRANNKFFSTEGLYHTEELNKTLKKYEKFLETGKFENSFLNRKMKFSSEEEREFYIKEIIRIKRELKKAKELKDKNHNAWQIWEFGGAISATEEIYEYFKEQAYYGIKNFQVIDTDKNEEAWVYVSFKFNGQKMKGVLTWNNSD